MALIRSLLVQSLRSVLQRASDSSDNMVTFVQFEELCKSYPSLLSPAFSVSSFVFLFICLLSLFSFSDSDVALCVCFQLQKAVSYFRISLHLSALTFPLGGLSSYLPPLLLFSCYFFSW
jgi:hypothetical protein